MGNYTPEDGTGLPVANRLRRIQWSTLGPLLSLFLATIIFYLLSRSTAVQLSKAANLLASSARDVAARKGDDAALRAELMLKLGQIERRDDTSEALLHLAVACFVAIFIVLTVELKSASRTRQEINEYRDAVAQEVWTALSKRLIPSVIVDEIRGILKADAVKDEVKYVLTFLRYDGIPDNLVVLQRKVTYFIRNVAGRPVTHPIRSSITSSHADTHCTDQAGAKITLPRHVALSVDKKPVLLSEHAGTLKRNKDGKLRDLRHSVDLTRKTDTAEVFMVSEEVVPLQGTNSYMQTVPVTGITVSVINKLEDLIDVKDVELAHPNWSEFVKGMDGDYGYPGGVLPGQSFTILWESKATPAPHGTPATHGMKG